MNNRTEGAWIIHHTKKIAKVTDAPDLEDIELAGKCGLFLSSLAASDEDSTLDAKKVDAIKTASRIKKVELDSIKARLEEERLIDTSKDGSIYVLGVTSESVLDHTANIFNHSTDAPFQKAALELSNQIGDAPQSEAVLKEFISDTFQLSKKENLSLFTQAESIGLIDYEETGEQKLYFNGNLFKADVIEKTNKILSSLSAIEVQHVTEVGDLLDAAGCILVEEAEQILGKELLSKLQSVGMYDFNEVSNDTHLKVFITKPSAFSKFGNPFEVDALDLAKAFIASLFYGMKVSYQGRGQIDSRNMLTNILNKLLRGEWVGPATAIGEDYQLLEMKRVIEISYDKNGMYSMRLLKLDIGRIALHVLVHGDLAERSTLETGFSSSKVSQYVGPEAKRTQVRKNTAKNGDIGKILSTLRV